MYPSKELKSSKEEWFNSISHGITALGAIIGLVILIVFGAQSKEEWSLLSAFLYGISLVVLYAFSTLYHAFTKPKIKRIFHILDHCAIFLLIAGTYTPLLLIVMGGLAGWTFFGLLWTTAIAGIVLKVFLTGRFRLVSTLIYVIMGWLILFKINWLTAVLPSTAFGLLLAGGISYTLGIIFYLLDNRIKYAHFIWHLFVIAGSFLHFLMIILYVLV